MTTTPSEPPEPAPQPAAEPALSAAPVEPAPSAEPGPQPPPSRKDGIIKYVVIGLVAALIAVNLLNMISGGGHALEGRAAPDFGLPTVDGGMLTLSDHAGKVVMLDFWATWCPPCRKQMPALQELASDATLADRLQIVSVNTDDPTDERAHLIDRFMRQNALSMTTVLDNGSVAGLYGVRRIPTLVVVAPDGRIHHVSSGVHDAASLRRLVADASK